MKWGFLCASAEVTQIQKQVSDKRALCPEEILLGKEPSTLKFILTSHLVFSKGYSKDRWRKVHLVPPWYPSTSKLSNQSTREHTGCHLNTSPSLTLPFTWCEAGISAKCLKTARLSSFKENYTLTRIFSSPEKKKRVLREILKDTAPAIFQFSHNNHLSDKTFQRKVFLVQVNPTLLLVGTRTLKKLKDNTQSQENTDLVSSLTT